MGWLTDFFFGANSLPSSDWVEYTYKAQADAAADVSRIEAQARADTTRIEAQARADSDVYWREHLSSGGQDSGHRGESGLDESWKNETSSWGY